MKRRRKRKNKAIIRNHAFYIYKAELLKLMKTDHEAVQKKLDEIALKDAAMACELGEKIGYFEPEPEDIYLGNGVYCTENCLEPHE